MIHFCRALEVSMDNSIQFQVQDTIRGCQRLSESAGGHLYAGLKIVQDGLHFCTSHVPQLRYLRYIQALYLILGYTIQSVYENEGLKIVHDGLHFCTSYVPQLRYLRYIQALYLILRYIIQSTNENAVLQCYFISFTHGSHC